MNQRTWERFDFHLPMSFLGKEMSGGGLITNLSKQGCAVLSQEPARPAMRLALRLRLPERDDFLHVDVAEVRWGSDSGFGLQFICLGVEEQERLHRFIDVLEASQNN